MNKMDKVVEKMGVSGCEALIAACAVTCSIIASIIIIVVAYLYRVV